MFSYSYLIFFAAAVAGQGISFITPATSGKTTAQNAIYAEGSRLDVSWTKGSNPTSTSLVLFQLNATSGDLLYPFEYLTQNVLNVTEFPWTVFTSKDLSLSPLFVMNIFYTGATSPVAVSAQFNISSGALAKTTTTSSSSSSSSSSSRSVPTTLSTSTTVSSSPETTASSTTSAASSSSGLSPGAKTAIGAGVAVPIVVVLAAVVGFFIWRNMRNKKNAGASDAAFAQNQQPHDPNKATAYTPMVMSYVEAPSYYAPQKFEVSGDSTHPQPHEMGQNHPQAYELPPNDQQPYEMYTPDHHGR